MEMKATGADERQLTGMKTKGKLLRWEGGVQGEGREGDRGGDEREGRG